MKIISFFLPEGIDFCSLPLSTIGCIKGWQLTLRQAPFVFREDLNSHM